MIVLLEYLNMVISVLHTQEEPLKDMMPALSSLPETSGTTLARTKELRNKF